MVRKILLGLLLLVVLMVSTRAVWLFYGSMPKKSPIRAKQVLILSTGTFILAANTDNGNCQRA